MKRVTVVAVVLAVAAAGGAVWFTAARRRVPVEPPTLAPGTVDDALLAKTLEFHATAVRRAPGDSLAWVRLAMAYHVHEFYAEAERCYDAALRLDPSQDRWRWLRAHTLEAGNRFDDALAEARTVLKAHPQFAAAYAVVARWHLAREKFDEALDFATRGTEADAEVAGAWIVLAQVQQARGDHAAAEVSARRALSLKFEFPEQESFAHYIRGLALEALGRTEEAMREKDRGRDGSAAAAVIDPWQFDLAALRVGFRSLVYAGHAALQAGNHEAAVTILEGLRARDPDHQQVAIDLGRAYRETGRFDEALDVLRHGIAKHPKEPALYVEVARVRRDQGDEAGALDAYRAAIATGGAPGDALEDRGFLHMQRGRTKEAVADFEDVLKSDPRRTWVLVHAGVALLESGDPEGAGRYFRRCAETSPGNADAYAGLAIVAHRAGDREAALRWLGVGRGLESKATRLIEIARDEIEGPPPPQSPPQTPPQPPPGPR